MTSQGLINLFSFDELTIFIEAAIIHPFLIVVKS